MFNLLKTTRGEKGKKKKKKETGLQDKFKISGENDGKFAVHHTSMLLHVL
jgi:hypothetical protein